MYSTVLQAESQYSVLRGLNVAVLVHTESLRRGARRSGRLLRYRALAELLKHFSGRVTLLAVVPAHRSSERICRSLGRCGFHAVAVRETPWNDDEDRVFCFEAGRMIGDGGFDAFVIGCSYAGVVLPVAESIRRARPTVKILTLSFPQFTHESITAAEHEHLFDGHLWAGEELTTQASVNRAFERHSEQKKLPSAVYTRRSMRERPLQRRRAK
jgi:hypothetical protein